MIKKKILTDNMSCLAEYFFSLYFQWIREPLQQTSVISTPPSRKSGLPVWRSQPQQKIDLQQSWVYPLLMLGLYTQKDRIEGGFQLVVHCWEWGFEYCCLVGPTICSGIPLFYQCLFWSCLSQSYLGFWP